VAHRRAIPDALVDHLAVCGVRIDDDHLLGAAALFEEVVDPLVLHPAVDEVELALAVLNDEFFDGVLAGEAKLVVRHVGLVEHVGDDVRDAHLGPHVAVLRDPEAPKLRHQRGFVKRPLAGLHQQPYARDHTSESMWLGLVARETQAGIRADRSRQIDVRHTDDAKLDIELVRSTKCFASANALHSNITAQRRRFQGGKHGAERLMRPTSEQAPTAPSVARVRSC
jgi:hypothetical protein